MSSPPPLSIVIPTHDTRELTLRCLGSLREARRGGPEGIEIVLVDDASRDGTAAAAAAAHPEVTILRNDEPAGFTRAANRGLAAARGDVLLLLNSDTEVDRPGLEALLDAFAADPRLGAAGAALHYPDGSPQWSGGREPTLLWFFGLASGLPALLGRLPLYRRLRPPGAAPGRGDRGGRVDWVTGAALAIRREAWEAAGPLDEGFRFYAQDLDYCLRLRQGGWRVALLPGFRVLHHHGATIGRDPGARRRQHPELLWSDLLRWAGKHKGEGWARRAALAFQAGGRLRLLGRALAAPTLPRERRAEWREDGEPFRKAVRSVGQTFRARITK
jgi:N-acetylglucosaminyl-diphospho-decaprenol L-rhamnosyltransferase